ncbi:MAG TPA: thioesterase family protein [Fimbriimonas sp.]|nr:thioesterase family protein [Fimbriimonas sp.]
MVTADAIDELQHVNNTAYLQYVELAARGHAEACGLTTERFIELGGLFVVRRHDVTYYAPAHLGDKLVLTTWVENMSGPRCTRIVEIERDGKRVLHALTEWVWIDPTTRAPKRIPQIIWDAFGPKAE